MSLGLPTESASPVEMPAAMSNPWKELDSHGCVAYTGPPGAIPELPGELRQARHDLDGLAPCGWAACPYPSSCPRLPGRAGLVLLSGVARATWA